MSDVDSVGTARSVLASLRPSQQYCTLTRSHDVSDTREGGRVA